jgi:hypothetical protein
MHTAADWHSQSLLTRQLVTLHTCRSGEVLRGLQELREGLAAVALVSTYNNNYYQHFTHRKHLLLLQQLLLLVLRL